MIKIIEVKETIADSSLIKDIYITENLIKDIIKELEANAEMNRDDYNFSSTVIMKVKVALQKVATLIKFGGEGNDDIRRKLV